eukprot:152302-Amphidinium_carterae.1
MKSSDRTKIENIPLRQNIPFTPEKTLPTTTTIQKTFVTCDDPFCVNVPTASISRFVQLNGPEDVFCLFLPMEALVGRYLAHG